MNPVIKCSWFLSLYFALSNYKRICGSQQQVLVLAFSCIFSSLFILIWISSTKRNEDKTTIDWEDQCCDLCTLSLILKFKIHLVIWNTTSLNVLDLQVPLPLPFFSFFSSWVKMFTSCSSNSAFYVLVLIVGLTF